MEERTRKSKNIWKSQPPVRLPATYATPEHTASIFSAAMAPIKVLITGGTGFLGSEIVKALVETRLFSVTAIDINPPSLGTSTFADVRYVRANILQREELEKVFSEARPDVVIHTVGVYPLGAARYSRKGEEVVFQINVEGTRNVVRASKACGARALCYTSSVTVVLDELEEEFRNVDERWTTGKATTSYGISKASRNLFLQCVLRVPSLFSMICPVSRGTACCTSIL